MLRVGDADVEHPGRLPGGAHTHAMEAWMAFVPAVAGYPAFDESTVQGRPFVPAARLHRWPANYMGRMQGSTEPNRTRSRVSSSFVMVYPPPVSTSGGRPRVVDAGRSVSERHLDHFLSGVITLSNTPRNTSLAKCSFTRRGASPCVTSSPSSMFSSSEYPVRFALETSSTSSSATAHFTCRIPRAPSEFVGLLSMGQA